MLELRILSPLRRFEPAREVAQIGAVIGRDFSYPLVRALAAMEDVSLQTALERLAEADILLVQGLPPDSEYRFKHVLIQDAAYENLLKSRRQVLHRRVGEVLRDNFPATAAAAPELVAHHFTQAGLTEAAIEWWAKAGQRSLERRHWSRPQSRSRVLSTRSRRYLAFPHYVARKSNFRRQLSLKAGSACAGQSPRRLSPSRNTRNNDWVSAARL